LRRWISFSARLRARLFPMRSRALQTSEAAGLSDAALRADGCGNARCFAVCKSLATLKSMHLQHQKRYEMFARPTSVAQNHRQQRGMDAQPFFVINEAKAPELVHKEADTWPRGSDHTCQGLLIHSHAFGRLILAEVS
jgi:hypothetical protein